VVPHDDAAIASCVRVCAGKGRSHEQARMSAISEAIERRSGEYTGDEPRVRATLAELADEAFGPEQLHAFSWRQYAERARLNAAARDRSQRVPEPLPSSVAIDWTPAWSLARRTRRLVPLSYCFAGTPPAAGAAYCPPNGNGVAAGSTLEEAILQALLELIERDAVALWWYNALARPRFELERVRDAYVEALLAQYRRDGADVWALDLTHDLGVPVCAAVRHDRAGGFSLGFGCHLEPELAVQRAVTELNQLGDGRHPVSGKALLETAGLPDRRFLFPAEGRAAGLDEHASFDGPDLAADITECLRRLESRGLEAFVVDKTRPDFGLAVAQVIVPGLRHFWPRFGAGRLYDVPVELGWLAQPKHELALNPVPLLL
jgi:ribosomal protein S12 methylthiotransferase accessory factor